MSVVRKRDSIYVQLLKLLAAAAFFSFLIFFLLNWAGNTFLEWLYISTNYEQSKDEEYIVQLQEYVSQNSLSTGDTQELTQWVQKQQVIALQIYKNKILVYDSVYPDWDLEAEQIEGEEYDWNVYYQVMFADGEADVSIWGFYSYQYYNYALVAELVLSFCLFAGIVLLGIRYKIRYIQKLNDEIGILESGDLDYEITVDGKDELAALAEGLDMMRSSFRDKVRQEAHLTEAHYKMVTEMSHDIRTPLTAVMLYTEILKKRQLKSEEQLWEYIDKIDQKMRRMKQLTDHLFEYALVTGETEVALEEPVPFEAAFYDLLSETCTYLEQNGFHTEMDMVWSEKCIQVHTEFLMRILDNITSNLLKYADPHVPIRIFSEHTAAGACLVFENVGQKPEKRRDSTGIGLENVKKMMERMKGSCITEEKEGRFRIKLFFPYTESKE